MESEIQIVQLIWKKKTKHFLYTISRVQLFATPWTAAHQASLSINSSRSLLKLTSIWVSDAIQLSHPLSSPSPATREALYVI